MLNWALRLSNQVIGISHNSSLMRFRCLIRLYTWGVRRDDRFSAFMDLGVNYRTNCPRKWWWRVMLITVHIADFQTQIGLCRVITPFNFKPLLQLPLGNISLRHSTTATRTQLLFGSLPSPLSSQLCTLTASMCAMARGWPIGLVSGLLF